MLIEFSVANYRSIKEKQVLSLSAAKGGELAESNTFPIEISRLPLLLRSAVLYGANASGKSNTIRALGIMQFLVLNSFSALQEGQPIPVTPFLFDAESSQSPSEFEITFINEGTRYQYGFAATSQKIMEEWLVAYPEGKPQKWFERVQNPEIKGYVWRFSRNFSGQKEMIKTATRSNALFLSTAIQLNNEQLKPVFNWFANKLAVILPEAFIHPQFTIDLCASESAKQYILSFMNAADNSITNINLVKKKLYNADVISSLPISESPEKMIDDLRDKDYTAVRFVHNINQMIAPLGLNEESQGTQKLFSFAGPWFDVLAQGKVLVIDELDTSLHPLLVRHLIGLFHNVKTNSRNAQLIITTHDTTLLDPDFYRRDQIWFTEKDAKGMTRLYSLLEFKPRKNEAFERGYLKGRYGALPFIGDLAF
ncbi:MAG: ATP-binding protein [Desulfobacteraceae bacterium]|nr:MAG: ATP-binding protein [Desulfobacteraceae bacterium]